MASFHVQRQPWQRWPRTLVCVKYNDDGTTEERRYAMGDDNYWKSMCRKETAVADRWRVKYHEIAGERYDAQETAKNMQAEIDGLKTMIADRDELIRDMLDAMVEGISIHACDYCISNHGGKSPCDGVIDSRRTKHLCRRHTLMEFRNRMEQLGIEED